MGITHPHPSGVWGIRVTFIKSCSLASPLLILLKEQQVTSWEPLLGNPLTSCSSHLSFTFILPFSPRCSNSISRIKRNATGRSLPNNPNAARSQQQGKQRGWAGAGSGHNTSSQGCFPNLVCPKLKHKLPQAEHHHSFLTLSKIE